SVETKPVGEPILQTIHTGGSGTGISYYKRWLGCCNSAWLSEQPDIEQPKKSALEIGTIAHAFLKMYHKREEKDFNPEAVAFIDTNGDPYLIDTTARVEAERLFRAYRGEFKPTEFGKIVAVEQPLPPPNDATMAAKICDAVGVEPFTFQADLVAKISEADCERLRTTRALDLPGPGYYLVDHKTESRHDSNVVDKWMNELQFVAYPVGWNAVYPKTQVRGTIVNIIFKTKVVDFMLFFVPTPNAHRVRVLQSQLALAVHNMTEHTRQTNTKHCWDYHGVCHWLNVGLCNQL